MHDIQNERDARGIEIDGVGISGLRYPVTFDDGAIQQTGIANIEITVQLQHDRRGTHMSRMVELVHEQLRQVDPRGLPIFLKAGAHYLDTPVLTLRLAMPFSTQVTAPVSGAEAWQVHDLTVCGHVDGDILSIETTVTSEVTSLCPCSKAVSDYGAHNQRSQVTLSAFGDANDPYPLPVQMALDVIRSVGSAPVIPLVKRPDERFITMQAFDHPAFVEDMARDISLVCRARDISHRVLIRNLESIHSHDAIAVVHG